MPHHIYKVHYNSEWIDTNRDRKTYDRRKPKNKRKTAVQHRRERSIRVELRHNRAFINEYTHHPSSLQRRSRQANTQSADQSGNTYTQANKHKDRQTGQKPNNSNTNVMRRPHSRILSKLPLPSFCLSIIYNSTYQTIHPPKTVVPCLYACQSIVYERVVWVIVFYTLIAYLYPY